MFRHQRDCNYPQSHTPLTLQDSVKIIVDHWQTVFSGNGGRVFLDFDVVGGRLHHKVTDSFPVMLHCPGLKKNQMEMKRLKEMGWEADVMDCE